MKLIIGIVGRIRSGKTTIAKLIAEKYGFTIRPMAQPLKAAARMIFDWTDEHVNGKLKDEIDERFGISPRQVLQHLGTEWSQFGLCKAFPEFAKITGRKVWAKNFALEYEKRKPINMIVDDIRFQHEIDGVRKVEPLSIILRVVRPELDYSDGHASEEQKDLKVDTIIYNDSDILTLTKKVEEILSRACII